MKDNIQQALYNYHVKDQLKTIEKTTKSIIYN